MALSPTIPFPVAQWIEPPLSGAAVPLRRMYWQVDGTGTLWTLTSDAISEAGRLSDPDHDGIYTLIPLASLASTAPTLSATQINGGTVLLY